MSGAAAGTQVVPVVDADATFTLPAAATPRVLGIDPGDVESAYALIEVDDCFPARFGKVPNRDLLRLLNDPHLHGATHISIEMISSYGMPVGREVFDTCVWVGRYLHHLEGLGAHPELVFRQPVKLHHCHSSKAKDSNITRALVDRFAPGQPNYGKGTKANPGWFHGFVRDVWAAYALAVFTRDDNMEVPF